MNSGNFTDPFQVEFVFNIIQETDPLAYYMTPVIKFNTNVIQSKPIYVNKLKMPIIKDTKFTPLNSKIYAVDIVISKHFYEQGIVKAITGPLSHLDYFDNQFIIKYISAFLNPIGV
jgi:hypothetical protein